MSLSTGSRALGTVAAGSPPRIGAAPTKAESVNASLLEVDSDRPLLELTITAKERLSERIVSLRLARPDGYPLPEWSPGAHISVTLPSGLIRQYSLCGDPAERGCYEIAVLREATSRGGSIEVHDDLGVGDVLTVAAPRNTFPLHDATASLLIGGGIGVTPLLPMARELRRRGAPFRFVAALRTRRDAAVVTRMEVPEVDMRIADEGERLDLGALLASLEPGTAVYCCGPRRMLDEALSWNFRLQRDGSSIHVERFEASGHADDGVGTGFTVTFARSAETVAVAPDQSILECARAVGIVVESSCEEGYCGTCETRVVDGDPEHRDDFLTPAEQESGDTMMICVSRARSAHLTLDL